MTTKNADLPAMPPNAGWEHHVAKGLTKREYFAGLAMQGMCSDIQMAFSSQDRERMAWIAVNHADALLAELEKQQ